MSEGDHPRSGQGQADADDADRGPGDPSSEPTEEETALEAPPARRPRWVAWTAAAVGALLIPMLIAFATGLSPSDDQARSPLIGKLAPPIETTDIDGNAVSTSALRGRWVLVNMFATWCVPCRQEHDDLIRFTERHRAAGDVAMVQVIFGDDVGAVRQFRAQLGGTWPIMDDPDGAIAVDYGVAGVPETFVVAPNGVIAAKLVGGVTDDGLERLLQSLGGSQAIAER